MIPLLALSIICLALVPLLFVIMALLSIPFAIMMAILPWVLRVATVVLLVRGLMEKPFHINALLPAAIAFGLSVLLR